MKQADAIHAGRWTRIAILPQGPRYWAFALKSVDLKDGNVFDLVADGLAVTQDVMDDITIVRYRQRHPRHARLRHPRPPAHPHTSDEAHGEALMDHSCQAFR